MPRLVTSTRNGKKFEDDLNHIYDKHKTNKDGSKQYWMCENRLCKARVHTYVGISENKIIKSVSEHNHSATAARLEAKFAKHHMKVESGSTQDAPRTIICKETQNLNE